MTTQATHAATDAAAAAAFDMLNAARRIEADALRAWMSDGSKTDTAAHVAYTAAIRAVNIAKAAYDAIREAGSVIRSL